MTDDQVPEGADGTSSLVVVASTKAVVDIGSNQASGTPTIVPEGARAEQGPVQDAVTPGDAIRRLFGGSLPSLPWLRK